MLLSIFLLPRILAVEINYIPKTKDPPSKRFYTSASSLVTDGTLYTFGGFQLDSTISGELWGFDTNSGHWFPQTPAEQTIPVERYNHGSFSVPSLFSTCIFGGVNFLGLLNDIWCFEVNDLTWSLINPGGPKISPRFRFAFTQYIRNSKHYFAIFGGRSEDQRLRDLCILDTETWVWTVYDSGTLPSPRSDSLIAYHDNYIYTATGRSDSEDVNDFYRFDLTNLQWEDISRSNTYGKVILASGCEYGGYFYIFSGWDQELYIDSLKSYRVDLTAGSNFDWEEIALDPPIERDSAGFSLMFDTFYIFGGYTVEGLRNDLIAINMTSFKHEGQVNTNEKPAARSHHSLEILDYKLFLFGGYSFGSYKNDLWKFDMHTEEWLIHVSSGDLPDPRAYHASSSEGKKVLIWGGFGVDGFLSDMYMFSSDIGIWEKLETVSDQFPTARIYTCVVMDSPNIYLYGGKTETELNSELWIYNTANNEYTLLNSNDFKGPGKVYKHECAIEKQSDGDVHFYVMFGTAQSELANGEIHYYSINNQEWTLLHTSKYPRNTPFLEKINRKIVIAGGETFGIDSHLDIFYIDLDDCTSNSCKEVHLGYLDDYFNAGAHLYIGNKLYFHGGYDSWHVAIRNQVSKNSFYTIDLFELCPSCNFDCSLGFIKDGDHCKPCVEGYFNEYYSSNCIPCSEGFYSNYLASSTEKNCIPCPEGFFNEIKGAYYCKDCSTGTYCPIGSSFMQYVTYSRDEGSVQPELYEGKYEEVYRLFILMIIIPFSICLLFLALLFLCKKTGKWLARIDIFSKYHTNKNNEPVVLTKNRIGSTFTILFLASAFLIASMTIPTFLIDNLLEVKSLVPYIILTNDYDFQSEIIVTVELDNYSAPCVNQGDNCDASISYAKDLIYNEGEEKLQCFRNNYACKIMLSFEKCSIDIVSKITFKLSDPLSYTSGIFTNITSFSSVPDEYSSASTYLESPYNTVFRGEQGSEFSYSMISSLYINSIDARNLTGYHVVIREFATPGSSYITTDVPLADNLLIVLNMARSENSLLTRHDPKSQLAIMVIALLGSISGAMGALTLFMVVYEKIYDKQNSNFKRRQNKNNVIEKRKKLKLFMVNHAEKEVVVTEDDINNEEKVEVSELLK